MYTIGEKIIYGENGVCTVAKVAPLESSGASDKLFYHLEPLIGSGVYFAPVDSGAFMRPVISREEAEALIDAIPSIEPAICRDNRFNHVDAFYKELFRQHSCEALVSIVKGLHLRKDILHGELSIALGMDVGQVEEYIRDRLEPADAE